MLTIKQGIRLSAIIDKLDLKITNPKAPAEEVGADLLMQVVTKAHRAEKEIYALVAEIKGITIEQAADIDLIEFGFGLMQDQSVARFFTSAAKSKGQG